MRSQNVVSRLLVHGWNVRLTDSEITESVKWISATTDGEQLARPSALQDAVKRVISGEQLLFILEPSWGAELKALIADVTLGGSHLTARRE